jgi:hypothetical protein
MKDKLKRASIEPEMKKLGNVLAAFLGLLPIAYIVTGEECPPIMQLSTLLLIGGVYLLNIRSRF